MSKKRGFKSRVARIKAIPFIDAFSLFAPWVEIPDRLPQHIQCPLPDHPDTGTPSCYLQEHRWFCFGCNRGGDVLDFACEYHEVKLKDAIELVEEALSIERDEDDLSALLAHVRASARAKSDRAVLKEWCRLVGDVENEFTDFVRPYCFCRDDLVVILTDGPAEYVWAELGEARTEMPRTARGRRDQLRRLRAWAMGWARSIERDVIRMVGKDRLDVALQSR